MKACLPKYYKIFLVFGLAFLLILQRGGVSVQAQSYDVELVKDIQPGSGNGISNSRELAVLGNTLLFQAEATASGKELWKSDGTSAGTIMVKDINPTGDSSPRIFTTLGTYSYFVATDGVKGLQLWRTDGSSANTSMIKGLNASSSSFTQVTIKYNQFIAFKDRLYFAGDDGTKGVELWKINNSTDSATLVRNINESPGNGSSVDNFVIYNNKLYFTTNGPQLWKLDIDTNGDEVVEKVLDFPNLDGDTWTGVFETVVYKDQLYAAIGTLSKGTLLWKFDNSLQSLSPVKPSYGSASDPVSFTTSSTRELYVHNNLLFFKVNDGVNGTEPWITDGTESGTKLLKNINPSLSSLATYQVVFNNKLYFTASDGQFDNYLWKTDGTTGGTVKEDNFSLVKNKLAVTAMTIMNNTTYFIASSLSNGNELYKLKTSSQSTPNDDNKNKDASSSASQEPKYKLPIMAGPHFVGIPKYIHNSFALSDWNRAASVFIDKNAHHDDLYIEFPWFDYSNIFLLNNPDSVKLPWAQGFNTMSEISAIKALSSFNGYPIPETDYPFIVLLGIDPVRLGNAPQSRVKIARFNEETKKWEVLKGIHVYTDEGKVATIATKFGYYAVVYPR